MDLPQERPSSSTVLKELLQHGSKILQLAASKVDQFVPVVAVGSSAETLERLNNLEEMMKVQREENIALHKFLDVSIGQVDATMGHTRDPNCSD